MSWKRIGNIRGPKGNQGKTGVGDRGPAGVNGRNGIGVPPGGDSGQVLTKLSGDDFDTYWADSGGGGGPATSAPKITVVFNCPSGTAIGDFVRVSNPSTVETISDNLTTTIPNGIFGVVSLKPTTTTAEVTFMGIVDAYSGFTVGEPVFIDVDGTPTQSDPASGIWQEVGKAVSTTAIFVNIKNPLEQY